MLACAGWRAQTEVQKTLPAEQVASQTEIKKSQPGQALHAGEPKPARLVGRGQERRHRAQPRPRSVGRSASARAFRSQLSTAVPYPDLHARRSLSPHHRYARRRLPAAEGHRPAAARLDPGLSLRPVRAGQVAHRHRYNRPGAGRMRRAMATQARRRLVRLDIDLAADGRAPSFVAAACRRRVARPNEAQTDDHDDSGAAPRPTPSRSSSSMPAMAASIRAPPAAIVHREGRRAGGGAPPARASWRRRAATTCT